MIISNYQSYLADVKNQSTSTVSVYSRHIKKFNRFLYERKKCLENPSEITILDIEEFVQLLRNNWCKVNSCNSYLFAIKNFLKYCRIHNIKTIDPSKIIFAKNEKVKIECSSEEEIHKLISWLKKAKYDDPILQMRDLTIIYTLLWTGLRVSELCNLKIEDIGEDLTIYGKWWKFRYVPCPTQTLNSIKYYLKIRDIKSSYVFSSHALNWTWDKLTRNAIWNILQKACKIAWIRRIWPHKLRHTYATLLLKRWANLFYIQKLLWHSSIDTTQRYLTCFDTDLKKTVELLPSR